MDKKYHPVIGLEVHVELATLSKMFCGCRADYFGKEPNTQTCPVCLGLPGALPIPNKKAIDWTIRLGLALNCSVNEHSKFDRKNYFYPDLPKGYQISQYDEPLCQNGSIVIGSGESEKVIRIRRVHIEEDTGKLQHGVLDEEKVTLVDFNRSGVPLVEVVTEPDFSSIEEVDEYVKKLQQIIRYLKISGADMEKGTMRLEPSISLTTDYKLPLPNYRVELKNINSFRFARKALEYEVKRQTEILARGDIPSQQTRGWNEAKNETVAQRDKEEANDYRYFPEPDIPPLRITKDQVTKIRSELPELPTAKIARFVEEYALRNDIAVNLTETTERADAFETLVRRARKLKTPELIVPSGPTIIANYLINRRIVIANLNPDECLQQISLSFAKRANDEGPIIQEIKKILAGNTEMVAKYQAGQKGVIGFLMSQLIAKFPTVNKGQLMQKLQEALD